MSCEKSILIKVPDQTRRNKNESNLFCAILCIYWHSLCYTTWKQTWPGLNIAAGVKDYFESHTSQDAMITVFCHSQGVAIVSNALQHISQEYRDMTIIRAIAPSVRIPDDAAADVKHYKSDADGAY